MSTLSWWMVIPAAVIVLVWAGWYVGMFVADRRRSGTVENDLERLEQDPDADDGPGPHQP